MWRIPKRDYKNNSFSSDKGNNKNLKLTHLGLMFPSYRSQSIDLHYKWTGWFIYDQSKGLNWVNKLDAFKVSYKNIRRNSEDFRLTVIKKSRSTLHETCPYFEFFWSGFSHLWTEYGHLQSKSPHSFRMWETRSRKIPNTDIFHAVGVSVRKEDEAL